MVSAICPKRIAHHLSGLWDVNRALVQCPHMTKLLTEVIRQIVELPEDRQDDAARVLMLMLEHDPEQYRLSDEQLREVDEAIAEVDASNFASDRDIDRALHRSWA